MISKARELMKHKASYNPIGFNLLPELFTLTQLQIYMRQSMANRWTSGISASG